MNEHERIYYIYITEFASVCERSTDFHFPSFEHQLSSVEECLQQANEARSLASASVDSNSMTSKQSDGSLEVKNLDDEIDRRDFSFI